MKISPYVSAACLCLATATATAGHLHSPSYSSHRDTSMYLFGGLGLSEFDYRRADFRHGFGDGSLSDIELDTDSTAVRFGVGLGITPNVAVEFGIASLGEIHAVAQSDGSRRAANGYAAGEVEMDGDVGGGFLGVRLHSPLSEPAAVFTRFGLYGWSMDGHVEDNDRRGEYTIEGADPYFGVGVMMQLSREASLSLAYDYYMLDDDEQSFESSADVLSMDIVFRF